MKSFRYGTRQLSKYVLKRLLDESISNLLAELISLSFLSNLKVFVIDFFIYFFQTQTFPWAVQDSVVRTEFRTSSENPMSHSSSI